LFCLNRMAQARSASLVVPQPRQLGDVGGDAPRLVAVIPQRGSVMPHTQ
jgi:hypothetical protein